MGHFRTTQSVGLPLRVFQKFFSKVDCAAPGIDNLRVAFGGLTIERRSVKSDCDECSEVQRMNFCNTHRMKFELGKYLVDPNKRFTAGLVVRRVTGRKDTILTEIKNSLSDIGGQRKCAISFLGCNLILEDQKWQFVHALKLGRSRAVDTRNRERIFVGVASGIAKLPSLGICHDEFSLVRLGMKDDDWLPKKSLFQQLAGEDGRIRGDPWHRAHRRSRGPNSPESKKLEAGDRVVDRVIKKSARLAEDVDEDTGK
jgi:hypothetical protein